MAACMPEPGHADPLSDMEAFDIRTDLKDMTNDLVPRNDRIACGDLTVCDMQIGTTDTASDDPDEKLAGARTRDGPLDAPQVRVRPVELHGDHHRHAIAAPAIKLRQDRKSTRLNSSH